MSRLATQGRLVIAALKRPRSDASVATQFKPKHGHSGDHKRVGKAYLTWLSMKQRCAYEGHKSYHLYGGAGIKVCERWEGSFENFLSDMGERPAGTSLDRIDREKGYEPGNCRWATPIQQAENRCTTTWLTAFGQKRSLQDLCREFGVLPDTVRWRLKKGMTPEAALLTPVKARNKAAVECLREGEHLIRHKRAKDGLTVWYVTGAAKS